MLVGFILLAVPFFDVALLFRHGFYTLFRQYWHTLQTLPRKWGRFYLFSFLGKQENHTHH
jgi:hypothetical protein